MPGSESGDDRGAGRQNGFAQAPMSPSDKLPSSESLLDTSTLSSWSICSTWGARLASISSMRLKVHRQCHYETLTSHTHQYEQVATLNPLPPHSGGWGPPFNTMFLGVQKSSPQTGSRFIQPLLHSLLRDRLTDAGSSIAIVRICCIWWGLVIHQQLQLMCKNMK